MTLARRLSRFGASVVTLAATAGACGGGGTPTPAEPPIATAARPRPAPPPPLVGLVPRPRTLAWRSGTFRIDSGTPIATPGDPAAQEVALGLARWLGLPDAAVTSDPGARDRSGVIVLDMRMDGPPRPPERELPISTYEQSYVLEVSPARALVRAPSPAGLRFGAEMLADLAGANRLAAEPLHPRDVPAVSVEDAPRRPIRGMHLDVARHFFDKRTVERYLDLLAYYRFDVFHWHLSDDQGFRLEIQRHPELTAVAGTDGFFTQKDAAEIVEYARARGITVIPEIDLPGHTRAILASHPELSCTGKKLDVPRNWGVFDDVLCAGNEKSYALVADILEEVARVFPSRVIHVGGDEVPETRWSACPKCRAMMAASHVGPAELESVFLRRVGEIVGRLGRRMAVWDEAVTKDGAAFPLPPDAIVFAWQSMERGRVAARRGYDVVMTPYDQTYFNFQQAHGNVEPGHKGYLPWSKVRRFEPAPPDLEAGATEHVLGAEGALWTEYVTTPADIETLVLPRMAALAEALWSGTDVPEPDFVARWNASLPALDQAHVGYFVEPPDLGRQKTVFLDAASLSMTRPELYPTGVVRWTEDGSLPSAGSPIYEAPLAIHDTKTVAGALFLASRHSPAVTATFDKRVPRPGVDLPQSVVGAFYTYIEGEFHLVPDFGRVTARSKGRAAAIRLDDIARAIGSALRTPMRKEDFALSIDAFFRVPTDGVYRLIAKADDGVKVEVDGEPVVTDDGDHGPRESDGQVALGAGYHALHVGYYQAAGGATLTLDIEGGGVPRGPVEPFLSGTLRP